MQWFLLIVSVFVLFAFSLAQEDPADLHARACVGLPYDSLHINGVCVVELRNRGTCKEIHRFFQTLNKSFTPSAFHEIHPLIQKRLRQEPAIQYAKAGDALCVNIQSSQQIARCPENFLEFHNQCYTATSRRVQYQTAQEECAMIRGSLVTENTPEMVEFLNYLVEYYIHDSIFTGFNEIHDSRYQKPDGFHVEANYQSGQLLYVPPTSSRRFICAVPVGIYTVALYNSIALLQFLDHVQIHDIDAPMIPNIKNFGTYLADLFEFSSMKTPHRYFYRMDLIESPPEDSAFIRSIGSLVLPVQDKNVSMLPKRVSDVCGDLQLLYRAYNNKTGVEFFTLKPNDAPDLQFYAIGFCSVDEGYCGTSTPIYMHTTQMDRPICYGFKYERDLDAELKDQKPFRYAQIAFRIEPIYSTYYPTHFNTHYHRIANSGGIKSTKEFQLINPYYMETLKPYCSKHLTPLYRVVDFINDNSMLVVNNTELDYYRKNRDQFEEEELLGYCSTEINYCGSALPIHKYTVYHEFANHIDSVYSPRIIKNKSCPDCDRYNYNGILCYAY